MEKLFKKVRFILSLKSNSAVNPDCLISALVEVNALNVNALLLATSTTIRLDPTGAALTQALEVELQCYTLVNMIHHLS